MNQVTTVAGVGTLATYNQSAAQAGAVIREEVRSLVIHGPDPDALLRAVAVDLEVAPTMDVDSDDMAAELQTMLGRLSTVMSAIESERKQRKAPLLDAASWLDGGYQPMTNRIGGIILAGKQKLMAWSTLKAAAARKLAEEQAEQRRKEAADAAAAETAALAKANAAAIEAQKLREAGSEQVAQAMETQAMVAVDTARQNAAAAAQAIYVAPVRDIGSGVKGGSATWKAECTDKAALIAHIGAMVAKGDKSLIGLLEVDTKAINALAKIQESNLSLPGVRPYSEARQAIRKVAVAA